MTRQHASTELHQPADAINATGAVVTKTVYLAARYTGRLELGLGWDLGATLSAERAELDTSG
jgi:hypothetical protein